MFFDDLSTELADTAQTTLANDGVTLTPGQVVDLANAFKLYLENNTPTAFQLNQVQPDFELVLLQFMQELSVSDAWQDQITAGTGQAVLRFMSAGTVFGMFGVIRALQETMLSTAKLANSVFTICRMLGVHILRNRPASLTATLNYSAPETFLEIPAFTGFIVGGINYFNRTPIIFQQGVTTQSVTLYQGTTNSELFISDGSDFQKYTFGSTGFVVSDTDIMVTIDGGAPWTRTIVGLWHYGPTDTVFYENSLQDGTCQLEFGNNVYGDSPVANSNILITWAETLGSAGNNLPANQIISCPSFTTISGTSTSISSGGDDNRDAAFYVIMAPFIYSSMNRAVTRDDYKAIAVQYPGVIDTIFVGQAEIDPTVLERMCVVEGTVLTTSDWDDTAWNNFITYLKTYDIANINVLRVDPIGIIVDVSADLYCDPDADLNSIASIAKQAIINLLTPGLGTLGWSLMRGDISGAITKILPQVQYVTNIKPNFDVIVARIQYIRLGKLTINAYFSTRNIVAH